MKPGPKIQTGFIRGALGVLILVTLAAGGVVGARATAPVSGGDLTLGSARVGRLELLEPRSPTADRPAAAPIPPQNLGSGSGSGSSPPSSLPPAPFPELETVLEFERLVEKLPAGAAPEVHGVYLTGYTAGRRESVDRILAATRGTAFNAFVIDVKNDSGRISYRSAVPQAEAAEAGTDWIQDPEALLSELRARGIYTIARIVVFKDTALAQARPDLAIHLADGGIWRDRTGAAWMNPYLKEVWDYNLAVAREAAVKGFSEIQFDYVRFPSDGRTDLADYGGAGGPRAETIAAFLKYAREGLEPLKVQLSVDIFGLVGTAVDDMGIGQHLETLLGTVDYISPMVYPSHYSAGNYGLEDPESKPYETVLSSLRDYQRRMAAAGSQTGLRPWLQDFSLRVHYGEGEVAGQIRAVRELGIGGFILWNPSNVYNLQVFRDLGPPRSFALSTAGD